MKIDAFPSPRYAEEVCDQLKLRHSKSIYSRAQLRWLVDRAANNDSQLYSPSIPDFEGKS